MTFTPQIDDDYLAVALDAASKAVDIAHDRPHGDDYDTKIDAGDIVTQADKLAEDAIIDRIRDDYPNHTIVGEESGTHDTDSDARWFLDPIDGTTNYLHDIPLSCTMIGVERDNDIYAGVIWLHHSNDVYYAVAGHGAYKNDDRLETSTAATIDDALFCGTIHGQQRQNNDTLTRPTITTLQRTSHGVRQLHCMGHNIALLAEGKVDGVLDRYTNPWDVAAATVIIREAGGRVTDCTGTEDWASFVSRPVHLLATNGAVHDNVLDIIDDHR